MEWEVKVVKEGVEEFSLRFDLAPAAALFRRYLAACDARTELKGLIHELGERIWDAKVTSNQRPERNAGATSVSISMPSAGVAHP